MVFHQEVKEYDPRTEVSYVGLITYKPKETTIRIDRMDFVLDTNLENIGRRARFGHIERHDSTYAVVVLEDDLGKYSFTFRRI